MTFRIAASCPACGAPIGLDAAATAVRCDRCSGAHLVLRGGGTTVAELAGRTTEDEAGALARAAVDDEMRRRGRGGAGSVVESALRFFAPVRVLVARLHEAAVVLGGKGDPEASVTARLVEVATTALGDPLGLATAPPLGEVDPRGLGILSRTAVFSPPFDAGDEAFAADAERIRGIHGGPAPPSARHAVAVPLARLLVLRPCRLVSVSSGRSRAAVLVDDAAREAVALLSRGAAAALLGDILERPVPVSPAPALLPMRCPECASPFPLDREGHLRLCPACRRAYVVAGRHLLPVPYSAELPPSPRGRHLVPAWRMGFALEDPGDGRALSSLAEVRERCGESGAGEPAEPGGLDVPAFLAADRRRRKGGVQVLRPLPTTGFPLFEGPARPEAGFPEPGLVGAIGPGEAAAVVRHLLLATLRPETVARASARRLRALLFEAPLRLGPARLVLRALRRADPD